MKIIETILSQLTDTDTILDSLYGAIAEEDTNYQQEMESYQRAVADLLEQVPDAAVYLLAHRQEMASDIRFAMWQGFMWGVNCHRDPIYKLMAQLDFEELSRESEMHSLPAALAAQAAARAFSLSLPENQCAFLDPIADHFAYLQTYGYKLAYKAGEKMANAILFLVG